MTSTDYADLCRRFVESIGTGEIDVNTCAAGFRAWTLGAGAMSGTRYRAGVRMLHSLFPYGLRVEALQIAAQASAVVVRARSRGVLHNSVVYESDGVFLFTIEGDRIGSVREYTDTKRIADVIHPVLKKWVAAGPVAAREEHPVEALPGGDAGCHLIK